MLMKRISKCLGDGSICIRRLTSSARSSMCCVDETRFSGDPPVLHQSAGTRPLADRSDHRSCACLLACARRAAARRLSRHRAVPKQPIESDHGRLKSRLRPMRGLKRLHSAQAISAGHGFVQNLHRGHYELGADVVDPRIGFRTPSPNSPPLFEPGPQCPTLPTTRQCNNALPHRARGASQREGHRDVVT